MTPTAPFIASRIHRTSASRAAALAFTLAASASLGMLSGCYSEGGSGMSDDQHVYVSSAWQPKTVTLKDTRTGQAFWSIDIPVGKKLVIQFREGSGEPGFTPADATPDMMLWDLMAPDEDFGPLANQIPVPPAAARRLDWVMRSTPELPESMGGSSTTPGPTPAATPKPAARTK
ncbi:MAG: hypothetical protein H7210_05925 [Pyrinomonadaceae bacterium]|nr:hypothetical protein [Phycisphaerales bacterium]